MHLHDGSSDDGVAYDGNGLRYGHANDNNRHQLSDDGRNGNGNANRRDGNGHAIGRDGHGDGDANGGYGHENGDGHAYGNVSNVRLWPRCMHVWSSLLILSSDNV